MSLTGPATPRGGAGRAEALGVLERGSTSGASTPAARERRGEVAFFASDADHPDVASDLLPSGVLVLPEVRARVAPAPAAFDALCPALWRYRLRVDGAGLRLTPLPQALEAEEEVLFSHGAVLDVVPVSAGESAGGSAGECAGESAVEGSERQHWMQIACGATAGFGGEATVTLALATTLDCMRVASALSHFQGPLSPPSPLNGSTPPDALLPRAARSLTAPAGRAGTSAREAPWPPSPSSPHARGSGGMLGSRPCAPPMDVARSFLGAATTSAASTSPPPCRPAAITSVEEAEALAEVPAEGLSPLRGWRPRGAAASAAAAALLGAPAPSRAVRPAAAAAAAPPRDSRLMAAAQEASAAQARPSVDAPGAGPTQGVEKVHCFNSLMLQVQPLVRRAPASTHAPGPASSLAAAVASVEAGSSLATWSEMYQAYRRCRLRVALLGLAFDGDADGGQAAPPPWSVPWVAVLDLGRVGVGLLQAARRPPSTHRAVVAVAFAVGGAMACKLHVAFESEEHLEAFLATAREQRRVHGALHPQGPALNRTVQVSSLAAAHQQAAKDAEAVATLVVEGVRVQVPISIATLFTATSAEDAIQPNPLNFNKVWSLVQPPSFQSFQLSSMCVDKLGLTLRPLVAEGPLPEACQRGARKLPPADGGGFALDTELLNFPLSAIMDLLEDVDYDAVVAEARASSRGSPVTLGSLGASGLTKRRQPPPFARASSKAAPPEEGADVALAAEGGGAEGEAEAVWPTPPSPHVVCVRVKGALAGKAGAGERVPAHMRLHAQAPPPIALFLAFPERADAKAFHAKVLAYKKYHLSIAVRTHVGSLAATARREALRRSPGPGEPELGDVAKRISAYVSASPSLGPPPLPPRPATMPPAHRLPRMVTNDEGEVFWYITSKPTSEAPSAAAAATAAGAGARGAAAAASAAPVG